MKRAFATIAAFACLAAALPMPAFAQTRITFWHYQTANRDALQDMIREFEAANPDVKIQEVFKDNNTMATEIQAAALARRAPDIGQSLGRLTVGLIRNANAVPLDSGADKGAFLANIVPNFLEIGRYQGKNYAVPQSFGTPVVYINRDLFRQAGLDPDKPPRTWQELAEQARTITGKTGKYALFISMGGRDVAQQQMMVNAGATMLSDDLSRATFATPDAIAAMQLWQDMAVKDKTHATFTEREQLSLFSGGQTAMMVGSVASFQGLKRDSEGKFDLGVAPYPTWGDKPRRVPNSGSVLMVFSQDEKRREAALRFVAHMTEPEISNRWAVISGYLPMSPDPLADPVVRDYLEKEPRWKVAVDQMKDTVATARWPGDRVVEIQVVLENMVQALMQNRGPAEKLVPQAQADINRILAESR